MIQKFPEKLIALCKLFIDNNNISFETLINNNFTIKDINEYLEKKLIALSNTTFILKKTKIIKDYAYYQLNNNNKEESQKAFNYLYNNYPKLKEGEMTKVRAYAVCENSLYEIAVKHNFSDFLYLGKSEKSTKTDKKDRACR